MPLPPNTRFAAGTSAVLLDVPETTSMAESSSPTVNAIGPVLVFASIVRSVMSLMVGLSFTDVTVILTVATFVELLRRLPDR